VTSAPPVPQERTQTIRGRIADELRKQAATAKELSRAVGISEKDVAGHLEHLTRSLRASGERIQVTPALCLSCGFTFKARERLTRPGSCPECRGTQIDPPAFQIVDGR